jgi:hypothetical protein
VGREDGPYVEFIDYILQDLRAGLAGDLGNGLGEPAVLLLPGSETPDTMDLLGRVAEVEVERKGTDKVGGLLKWQGGEQFTDLDNDVVRAPRTGGISAAAGGFLGFLGQQAHLLHELEQFGTVLPDQGLAQQGGNPANVGPQFSGEISV